MIGSEASYGPYNSRPNPPTREVVMWIGVQHQEKAALEVFSREVAPAGTGMAPGQTTLIGGRPKVYILECDFNNAPLTQPTGLLYCVFFPFSIQRAKFL